MTAAPVLARSLKYSMLISRGENSGKVYSFDKAVITIGRGPQNDIILSSDPKISRMHVEIKNEAGFLKITNLSDRNFILIDGEKTDSKYTQQSVVLQIGETILNIQVEPPPAVSNVPSVTKAPPTPKSYGPPSPKGPASTPRPSLTAATNNKSRLRFYMIVLVIGGALAWLVLDTSSNKKTEIGLRTEGDIVRAIEESTAVVKELKMKQDSAGQNTIQYRSAQEHYIKGFRDYRQRQYARAMQSFQAALSFYPGHELAQKYLVQSQRKFEEMVDSNMSLGRKNYEKQSYKLCQASFANVMIMLKDSNKPKYREAKQFYDECSLRLEGRF